MINQSKLEYIITNIHSKKVLVVGDIMLDKYVFGHVDRISPEAPIPIISVKAVSYTHLTLPTTPYV